MKRYEGWALGAVVCLMGLTTAQPASAQTDAFVGAQSSGIDMDSVEGFFCMIEANSYLPFCAANGQNMIQQSAAFTGVTRVALDWAGRMWVVRNSSTNDAGGIFVEVDEEPVLLAELPPMSSGDFVDSLALVGAPEMQAVPGVLSPLPLRTLVVMTAQRRLYVYAWWTEAEDDSFDAAGNLVVSGNTVPVTPGWYEVDEALDEWLLASPAAVPTTAPPLEGTFYTLSHAPLGNNIRVAMLLDDSAATNIIPVHVKASVGGRLLFLRVRKIEDALPTSLYYPITNEHRSWQMWSHFGYRHAWSADYYISNLDSFWATNPEGTQGIFGPFIMERGRTPQIAGLESVAGNPWTLVPSFSGATVSPFNLVADLPLFEVPLQDCTCAVAECNCDDRPSYFCNDLNIECYTEHCAVQEANRCYDPGSYHSFYKVVPADGVDIWNGQPNVKMWFLGEKMRVYAVNATVSSSFADPTRIDPWPDVMLEESGYRPLADAARGTVYEKLTSGYAELPSEPIPTPKLALPASQLAIDVFVPSNASGWVGDLQMTFELAAAGISESYAGYAGLGSLQKGAWSTVTFSVPLQWRQAMLGDFPGVRFRTFLNTAAAGVRIGALRFQGTQSSPRTPHQARLPGVRTTQALDFETSPGWSGSSVELSSLSSTGQYSVRLTSSGWTEMVSPAFSTNSLPAIGTKLSVDLFVPPPSPESHWQGDIQAFLTCQNTAIQNAWIDWSGLQNLFSNEYNTVTLDMPQSIRTALQVPGRTCTIRLTVNTAPTSAAASFYVDRVGFRD